MFLPITVKTQKKRLPQFIDGRIQFTWQKTANSPVSHETFPYSILKQGFDVRFHSFLLKTYGHIRMFTQNANQMTKLTQVNC